ncbi:uncharacterized protein MYCFIDRAFT_201884 [Pseudocercospora fijiensis CIRAD86]|uniref:Uncharacterized protein n=1 Tax=Pseudocercospora fijiensis (strain CIRAD86) TaxID=383855 RepID=N1QCT2_PSEFD|nr:uncharacterized protein MYCFIDRAFT_201884 [Pseudocercospora fijiensis CIRAD86]EME89323.1 hypothetical protein MYCFIDRAFT_201884 [Pseudocercospora fijiensis CIRAD86]
MAMASDHGPFSSANNVCVHLTSSSNLLYPAYNFSVPVDHFHNESQYEPHSNATFPLRYWFDASHYKKGGPVFVLQSGETSGVGRLPFLQKGIVSIITRATNGIGVILEHRYYGTSWPVPDLSTHNFRFLTTAQAMADEAYFAQNIKFPGLEEHGDLTSKTTAWISYGGSYAGAFSAFLRLQYPDVFWGSISSSGVTKAIWDYWQYFQPIAEKAPQDCIAAQRLLIDVIDSILIDKSDTNLPTELKSVFGFENVTYLTGFADVLTSPLSYWQSLNWVHLLYPGTDSLRSSVTGLIQRGGRHEPNEILVGSMLNAIGYFNLTVVDDCASQNMTQDECFGSDHNKTYTSATSIEDAYWKSWPYQYCTEWGYLQTGNTPKGELPLISRTLDLEYRSLICRMAFNITEPPNLEVINKYGGYDISYPRLAIVDGDWDPWKPATPHAFEFGAKDRSSNVSEPFILISEAVHHWDENGLFPNQTTAELPPPRIVDVQAELVQAVHSWMLEWDSKRMNEGSYSTHNDLR